MAKPIDLSTAGIRFGYAHESTAGTRPSSFTNIYNPKQTPDFNPEPSALDITSLNDEVYKRYMSGLKDFGGALAFTFGMSEQMLNDWNNMCDTAETLAASGKRTWFVMYHPKLTKSFAFVGEPTKLGFPEANVDEVWDATVYIAPKDDIDWITAVNPTDPVSA